MGFVSFKDDGRLHCDALTCVMWFLYGMFEVEISKYVLTSVCTLVSCALVYILLNINDRP